MVGTTGPSPFWETELYEAPPEKAEPDFQNRPQRFSARGACAKYIDHVTVRPAGGATREPAIPGMMGG